MQFEKNSVSCNKFKTEICYLLHEQLKNKDSLNEKNKQTYLQIKLHIDI